MMVEAGECEKNMEKNTGKGISVLERYQVTGIFYDKEYKKYSNFS